MNNNYSNPPFLEAVFELHTSNDGNWDLTFHGNFYEKIKEFFPNKTTEKKANLFVTVNPKGIDITSNKDEKSILKSTNDDNTLIVQFSENHLVVNAVRPYVNWDCYKTNIIRCLSAYIKVVNPTIIESIRLRYINKMDYGKEHNYKNIETTFEIRPFIPDDISSKLKAFQMITEYILEDEECLLSVKQASLNSDDKMIAPVLFDLTYIHLNSKTLKLEEIEKWLETGHENIESAFEKGLTESIKTTFK